MSYYEVPLCRHRYLSVKELRLDYGGLGLFC